MKGKFITHLKLDGHMQMGIDEYLLNQSFSKSNYSVIARFYTWEGVWISLGRNQKIIPSKWHALENQQKIKLVRRPTGGDAVLHSGGLTYSLIWNNPPIGKKEAYIQASQWLIKGFKKLGIPLEFGNQKSTRSFPSCFSRATSADLIDKNGCKRIGSAQFWQKGHLLQHGEILIAPPQDLWVELFEHNPPKKLPKEISHAKIESILSKELVSHWSELNWHKSTIREKDLEQIKSFNKSKFSII
tara:strand:+ start:1318 stop:2046 length:729 start_codon:yes stop_codon:yes gene_type:complete